MDKDPIVVETCEISQLIKDTPRSHKEEVEVYHKEIIKRLDSNEIISVPSLPHRQLHQQIWLMSFTIYNKYFDTNSAYIDFLTKSTRDKNGEYPCERVRFDVYYDQFYITPYLKREEQRIAWAKDTDRKVREDVTNGLHKNLEDVFITVD